MVKFSNLILAVIDPVTKVLPPSLMVLFLAGLTGFLTNFTSNMTAMVLMLSVGLSLASGIGAVEPVAVTLTIIIVSDFAFIVPSSSNLRSIFAIIGVLVVALIGYPFSLLFI